MLGLSFPQGSAISAVDRNRQLPDHLLNGWVCIWQLDAVIANGEQRSAYIVVVRLSVLVNGMVVVLPQVLAEQHRQVVPRPALEWVI
ncbi:hypothetical protein [Xenophilus sp. Marseille-Q4582]|uniref:hypothetical protein n=1 Tax=Xenophilus sp. Marseille-Q4582 TaxID=2866600 RepID=UPI001CE47BDE|nr:hypothetical protein [Xenophilus sp. Marseille-Q4582]